MTFATRRAGVHLARLSLLALVVALVVAGIGGIHAVSERMLAEGAARILTGAEPGARTVRVVASEASGDGQRAQDASIRDAIATSFGGSEIAVTRLATVTALQSGAGQAAKDDAPSIRLLDDQRVPGIASLTGGRWPLAAGEIALTDAAAQRKQLAIGDAVVLSRDGTRLTLVGTWIADDPTDPAWYGDPAIASGESDGAIGPAIVAHGALAQLVSTPTITWEIAPVGQTMTDIAVLQRALNRLGGLPEAVDPQRQHNTRVLGELDTTLHRQAAAVSATRGLLVAPLLIIGLLGALVLGIVLTSVTTTRGEEIEVLRARGASGRRLAAGAAGEAAVFSLAGVLAATLVLAVTVGIDSAAMTAGAGAVVFAAAFSAVMIARRADVVRADARRSDAGARTLPSLLLPAGVAVALAALSAWQLFSTGTVVQADGAPEPLAAAAPALMLIAGCALAPVAAGPLAALLERLLRGTRGIGILSLRQIARRMGGIAVAILCLALAASAAALAIAAPSAAQTAEQRTLAAALGGDVRVASDDPLDTTAVAVETWTGVASAYDVLSTPLAVGSDAVRLVSGAPDALGFAEPIPLGSAETVGAAITRAFAERIDAAEGTVFTARVRSVARPVSFEVLRVVDALPGVGDALGVAADPAALQDAGVDTPANELWVRTRTPDATAAQLRAAATHPVRILTAAQVSAAPVTSIAPTLLVVGALMAAALGVIGFLAAFSATARARRDEPLVLRALGLRAAHQRASRIGESAGLAGYAVLAGAAVGIGVAAAVLPIVLGAGS
ncbi:hypothetical protein [Microbacterium alcoholitolerans]|uniref:hypothetical protein n=1 Tax=unclassified Microbacterium TaxID=2609290 RepID=UPI003D167DBD